MREILCKYFLSGRKVLIHFPLGTISGKITGLAEKVFYINNSVHYYTDVIKVEDRSDLATPGTFIKIDDVIYHFHEHDNVIYAQSLMGGYRCARSAVLGLKIKDFFDQSYKILELKGDHFEEI